MPFLPSIKLPSPICLICLLVKRCSWQVCLKIGNMSINNIRYSESLYSYAEKLEELYLYTKWKMEIEPNNCCSHLSKNLRETSTDIPYHHYSFKLEYLLTSVYMTHYRLTVSTHIQEPLEHSKLSMWFLKKYTNIYIQ
jgi:hypothetical protein